MTTFFIATTDSVFHQRVRAVMGASNGQVRHLDARLLETHPQQAVNAVTLSGTAVPDVVALGPGLSPEVALDVAQRFDEEHPEVNVLIVAPLEQGLLERGLRAGVRDIIPPEVSDEDLFAALERAGRSATRRRSNLGAEHERPARHRFVTVVSPKGGSGKTAVMTNLAVGMASAEPGSVVLVDLDLTFGDVASALRLMPEHSMADVAGQLQSLDPLGLKAMLTPYGTELACLCAPESPAEGEQISGEQTSQILHLLGSEFRYVLVDTSAGLNDHTLSAIEVSTDLLFVCTMDVPSVRSLHKVVVALDQLGMMSQRRHFILNRAQTEVGLDTEDIERTVGLNVSVAVPSSRLVPLSMNQGEPIVRSDERSPVARRLQELVQHFVEVPAAHRGGLFRSLRRR